MNCNFWIIEFIMVFFFFVGPKDAQLNVSWTPKVIDPDKSVELYFNITNRKIYFMQMGVVFWFFGGEGGGLACVRM